MESDGWRAEHHLMSIDSWKCLHMGRLLLSRSIWHKMQWEGIPLWNSDEQNSSIRMSYWFPSSTFSCLAADKWISRNHHGSYAINAVLRILNWKGTILQWSCLFFWRGFVGNSTVMSWQGNSRTKQAQPWDDVCGLPDFSCVSTLYHYWYAGYNWKADK